VIIATNDFVNPRDDFVNCSDHFVNLDRFGDIEIGCEFHIIGGNSLGNAFQRVGSGGLHDRLTLEKRHREYNMQECCQNDTRPILLTVACSMNIFVSKPRNHF